MLLAFVNCVKTESQSDFFVAFNPISSLIKIFEKHLQVFEERKNSPNPPLVQKTESSLDKSGDINETGGIDSVLILKAAHLFFSLADFGNLKNSEYNGYREFFSKCFFFSQFSVLFFLFFSYFFLFISFFFFLFFFFFLIKIMV
jgi:hypothetical protein